MKADSPGPEELEAELVEEEVRAFQCVARACKDAGGERRSRVGGEGGAVGEKVYVRVLEFEFMFVKLRVSMGGECGCDTVLCVRVVVHEGAGECVCSDLVRAGEEGADGKLRGDQDAPSSSSRAVSAPATCSRSLVSLDASSCRRCTIERGQDVHYYTS